MPYKLPTHSVRSVARRSFASCALALSNSPLLNHCLPTLNQIWVQGRFKGGLLSQGLKEGGIALAPVRLDSPGKEEALRKVEDLKATIIAGEIQIPTHISQFQKNGSLRP